jgi:putative Ca2+/H+ antiporter (TMEM165/GDT1 family)
LAAHAQILVTELGDETFIIAAIMAMRHPRLVIYAGAMSALGLMTVLPCSSPAAMPPMRHASCCCPTEHLPAV